MSGDGASERGVRESLGRLYDDPDEAAARLRDLRPADGVVCRQRATFAALANEDRLRLLAALRDGERCGCELVALLDAPQSTVSTHLRRLREAGLVESERRGRWNYYRIADAAAGELLDLSASVGDR